MIEIEKNSLFLKFTLDRLYSTYCISQFTKALVEMKEEK